MQNLKTNSEFITIVVDALQDYREWLEDDPDNQQVLDAINQSLDTNDYFNCAYLDDALITWSKYLQELMADRSNPTAQANAQHDLALIEQYLNH